MDAMLSIFAFRSFIGLCVYALLLHCKAYQQNLHAEIALELYL